MGPASLGWQASERDFSLKGREQGLVYLHGDPGTAQPTWRELEKACRRLRCLGTADGCGGDEGEEQATSASVAQ